MVRPGLILYGLPPVEGIDIKLKPVMSLKTRVVYSKDVPAGCGISYGHTYVTGKPGRIVTLPIGYGDGYPRNLSNSGPVLINGKKFTISGRVCMDQVMVDVGDCRVNIGDEAVLIGSQGSCHISADTLAQLAATISYEIVCGIGSRVPRIYKASASLRGIERKADIPVEMRRAERHERAIPVRFLDTPTLDDTMAVTHDISATGLCLMTARQMQPYKRCDMYIDIPHSRSVKVSGTTVWSKPVSHGRYSCGIKLAGVLPSKIL
jgi:hypothetical protein